MRWSCPEYRTACQISRRRLLQAGTAGIAGLSLPTLIQAEQNPAFRAHAKHIIFLHQFGGPSHLDTFDMKPSAPAGIRGEFQPIATGQPGLTVCEHLPRFATVIDEFAQVRSVHHGMKNHNSATYYSLTGHVPPLDDIRLRDTQELYPAYGSTGRQASKPAEDRASPVLSVSFPHVLRDGSVTPGPTWRLPGQGIRPILYRPGPQSIGLRAARAFPAVVAIARPAR